MNQHHAVRWLVQAGGLLAFTAIVAAGYLIGYRPHQNQQEQLAKLMSSTEELTAHIPQIHAQNQLMTETMRVYSTHLEKWTDHLPTVPQDDRLIADVSQMGRESRLELLELAVPQQPSTNNDFVLLRIGFRGRYMDICTFLEQFGKLPRVSKITLFSLQDAGGPDGLLELRMELKVFYRNDPESIGQGDRV